MAGSSLDNIQIVGKAWTDKARYKEPDNDNKGAMYSFRVSTPSRIKNQDTNKWENGPSTTHYVTVFGPQAVHCKKSIKNGSHVIVIGYNRTRSYEKDGEKRYSTDLVADFVGLSLYWDSGTQEDSRGDGDNSASGGNGGRSTSQAYATDPFDDTKSDDATPSEASDSSVDTFFKGGDDNLDDIFS